MHALYFSFLQTPDPHSILSIIIIIIIIFLFIFFLLLFSIKAQDHPWLYKLWAALRSSVGS